MYSWWVTVLGLVGLILYMTQNLFDITLTISSLATPLKLGQNIMGEIKLKIGSSLQRLQHVEALHILQKWEMQKQKYIAIFSENI